MPVPYAVFPEHREDLSLQDQELFLIEYVVDAPCAEQVLPLYEKEALSVNVHNVLPALLRQVYVLDAGRLERPSRKLISLPISVVITTYVPSEF